jgi:type II secretory pathway component GspD/PulD (secretin)
MSISCAGAAVQEEIQPPDPAQAQAITTTAVTAPVTIAQSTNGVRLDFRGASLSQVLDALSDSAGFVIVNQSQVSGTVELWSKGSVTRDEAVELLNSALQAKGYTVIRNGRILTIANLDRAKTADLDVVTGSDPEVVKKSGTLVTQIIPVRYADASRLVNNLRPLLPPSATLSVNESANALILVDTKTAIRRMLQVVSALDTASARASAVKVFPLRYADAKDLATTVQEMFATSGGSQVSSGGSSTAPSFGPTGESANSSGTGRTATAAKVVATADERANSLIVAAPADLMPSVANLVQQLDQDANDLTVMRIFRLRNADPAELVEQLGQLFPDETGTESSQDQPAIDMAGPPGAPGSGGQDAGAGAAQSDSGERKKKQGRVLAVADQRSSSILVSASATRMPHIAALIKQLDAQAGRKETISYWNLRNADPYDAQQILQTLFNRNTSAQNNNANPLLGQNNPLILRQTQQQTSTTTTTGSSRQGGSSSGGGSAPSGN